VSAFTLPRNSNLAAGQLDLIEDLTGVVAVTGQNATITSPIRGTLTAIATSATNFDPDPSNTLCPTGTKALSTCVSNGQIASMDAVLNSDGTFTIQEIEPLFASQQDIVEGIVFGINGLTQFSIVVTDKVQAAQNSLLSGITVGDSLAVNISANPNLFRVDTKGLPLGSFPTSLSNFAGATDTNAIHLGQTVAVHATAFAAAIGNAIATSTTDIATLRWSRFTATPTTAASPAFSITNLPPYFSVPQGSIFVVQTFPGPAGTDGITNFEGVTDASGLSLQKPVAMRALYLQNSTNTAQPAFFAAKVRQH
jgi:hypothetical protein